MSRSVTRRISFLEAPATMLLHLRSRTVRIILVVTPATTVMAAIFPAIGPDLVLGIVLSTVARVLVSSSLFIAVGSIAREIADERLLFAHTLEAEQWHVRAQRLFSGHRHKGGLYADWYFRARLEEEVERTLRYNVPFTLLIAKKAGTNGQARQRMAGLLGRAAPAPDRPARPPPRRQPGHHPTAHGALQGCLRPSQRGAGVSDSRVGLALFPKDGEDGSSLHRAADVAAEQTTPPAAASAAA